MQLYPSKQKITEQNNSTLKQIKKQVILNSKITCFLIFEPEVNPRLICEAIHRLQLFRQLK